MIEIIINKIKITFRNKNKILLIATSLIVLITSIKLCIPKELEMPDINDISIIIYSNRTGYKSLSGQEKQNIYIVMENLETSWNPLKRIPREFSNDDNYIYISVMGKKNFGIHCFPNGDSMNNIQPYAYLKQHNNLDCFIVDCKNLFEFIEVYQNNSDS